MVSIRDVARHAGVSIGTASNVLNQPEHVKPANIAKVHASMRELGFVRNDLARQLRVGTGTTIGLIVLNLTNPLFADLAQELEEVAEADGKTIVVGSSAQVASREDRYIDMFVEQRVRGLLIAPLHGVSAKIKQARERGVPMVLFDSSADPAQFCSVTLDGEAGGHLAVSHLIAIGRRRILFVGGPLDRVTERLAGASRAVQDVNGVSLALQVTSDLSVDEGRRVGDWLLEQPVDSRPDAIFAANDLIALGLLQTLVLANHVRIPEDIALIGYDDIAFASSAIVPLSTVRQPLVPIAEETLRLLEDEAANGPEHQHSRLLLAPELVVRTSTST